MNLRIFFCLIVLTIFSACKSYKFKYVPISEYENIDKLNVINAKYIKENELYLTFTSDFNNDHILLYENDMIKFDSVINNGSVVLGIAKSFKVKKDSEIKIYFDYSNKPVNVKREQMKEYKFIYISKRNKKFVIEFNNGTKKFE